MISRGPFCDSLILKYLDVWNRENLDTEACIHNIRQSLVQISRLIFEEDIR